MQKDYKKWSYSFFFSPIYTPRQQKYSVGYDAVHDQRQTIELNAHDKKGMFLWNTMYYTIHAAWQFSLIFQLCCFSELEQSLTTLVNIFVYIYDYNVHCALCALVRV